MTKKLSFEKLSKLNSNNLLIQILSENVPGIRAAKTDNGLVFDVATSYQGQRHYKRALCPLEALDVYAQIRGGAFSVQESPTLKTLYYLFLETNEPRDRSDAHRLAFWGIEFKYCDLPLVELKTSHLKTVKNQFSLMNRGRGLSNSTSNKYKSGFSKLWAFGVNYSPAKAEGDLGITDLPNPVAPLDFGKPAPKHYRVINESQLEVLLAEASRESWAGLEVLVYLAFYPGARVGALLKLKWSDINLHANTITFRAEHQKNGEAFEQALKPY